MICLLTPMGFSQWSQLGIDIDGEAAGDRCGWSVSLSADGTRVAIGSPRNDGAGFSAGHVRIYELIAGTWTQVGADIDGEGGSDESGTSVSLSADGTRVAIGAPFNGGARGFTGHVRIYKLMAGSWIQVGADIEGERDGDQSGISVSLSADGSRVAIGADHNFGTGMRSGQARIYELNSGIWTQVGADINGAVTGDESGRSVSLSADGSRVAVGGPMNDGAGNNAGHVRIYELMAGAWTQVGIDIDGEAAGNVSGWSVSLSNDGTRVAIGAPGNHGAGYNVGHVRIYELIAGTWTQVGTDIDGEDSGDYSGWSVALSNDGNRVAIGAIFNSGAGSNTGHARIYELIAGIWTQIGADIDGEAAGDRSGISVSLSADGSRAAIGTPFNNGAGGSAGHVRIYGPCPDLTAAAPIAQVSSESICTVFGGTLMGGVIATPSGSCPVGSILMYSTDGMTFSSTLPEYDQVNAITVTTRCDCDGITGMSPTSAVTTMPGTCPICPDLTAAAPIAQVSSESTCTVFGGTPMGGIIAAPSISCPVGSTLMYSTDGTTFSSTLPEYDQVNDFTETTRCDCVEGSDISPTSAVTTMPGTCPVCPDLTTAAPVAQVSSESTCTVFDGIPIGGVIAAPNSSCPMGSTLMYSTDGATFSSTLPEYDQVNAITVTTRCDCVEGSDISPTSAVTTMPGTCPICPDFTGVIPALPIATESICNMIMGMPMGGSLEAPVDSGCPIGSSLEYSLDAVNFFSIVPEYDQVNSMTVTTRCACDNDGSIFSRTSILSTSPGLCPLELTFNSLNMLMFKDPCSCTDPTNCDVAGVTFFHDTLLITGGGATNLIITTVGGATDFYIDVPCFGGGPSLIPSGMQIPEVPIGSGMYKIEFWRPSGTIPILSVMEGGLVTPIPSEVFDPACAQQACIIIIPTLGQWSIILLSLLLMILGIIGLAKSPSISHEKH